MKGGSVDDVSLVIKQFFFGMYIVAKHIFWYECLRDMSADRRHAI